MRMNHGVRLASRIAIPIFLAISLSLLLVGGSALAKGRPGGGGGGGSCVRAAPGVAVDNNWAWSSWGSWGYPGQELAYAINVVNYDVGCAAASFVVDVQAPSGFEVVVPTNTVSLKASKNAYLWAYVTSPTGATDGDYPVTVSVRRANTSGPVGSFTSYYKVYTTDATDPTLFWVGPADGQALDSRTVNFTASSSDDHAVRAIDLFVDDNLVATTSCDDVSYICQLSATWSATNGSHTATFWSYDWMGNTGTLSVSFTVGTSTTTLSVSSTGTKSPSPTNTTTGRGTSTGHGKSASPVDARGKAKGQGPRK
jgi:Big-like domain-containing protein